MSRIHNAPIDSVRMFKDTVGRFGQKSVVKVQS